ncbi:MAG: calcium/sodium antiporter [Ruminococcaceae bacterium]|nr:calcium/sodium antiporter [Oscillospiraceae bacterium]
MEIALIIFLFAIGVVLIVKGGDFFVDAASWFARISKIPKFVVGATIVSLATTLPEIIVSSLAAFEGKVDMATGNAIGSVTANTGMIMAIGILFMTVAVNKKLFIPKAILLISIIVLLILLSLSGELTLVSSIILFVLFAVFIFLNIKEAKQATQEAEEERPQLATKTVIVNVLKFVFGAAGIVLGSQLLVDNGSEIALMLNVPENIIALTAIAIGTSLPELVTTITAIVKKESSLSVGNIIGANTIDMALILPICSIISKGSIPVNAQTIAVDIPVCLAITLVMLVPTIFTGKFQKWQGITGLVIYASYLTYIFIG